MKSSLWLVPSVILLAGCGGGGARSPEPLSTRVAFYRRNLVVHDLVTGQEVNVAVANTGLPFAFGPQGVYFVTKRLSDNAERIRLVRESGITEDITPYGASIPSMSLAPDGQRIAAVIGGAIKILARTGVEIYSFGLPGATVTSVAWSPDGLRLAASGSRGTRQVYTLNVDGTNVQQISPEVDNCSGPAWSPDGTQLAYMVEIVNGTRVAVHKLGEPNYRILALNPEFQERPFWSADGKNVIYSEFRFGQPYRIFTASADGTGNVLALDGVGPGLQPVPEFFPR